MSSITEIRNVQGRHLPAMIDQSDFAVVPLASVEYHGPHAPIGTDLILAEGFAKMLAGSFNALVYPPIAYSACPGKTQHYPGTVSISPSVMTQYVCEVLAGICRTGLNRIVLLNAHDANMGIARTAAEWVTGQFTDCSVLILNWWQMVTPDTSNSWGVFSGSGRGHGGPYEIAAVQAFAPETVQVLPEDIELPSPPPLSTLPYVLVERQPAGWDGYTGRIHEISAETGKRIVDEAARNLSSLLADWISQDTR